jgi:arsenite/tail-anchored protein-transporting ATPase
MRIIIVTGKGGVGKTSIAAATALRASKLGLKTLVMSTDTAHSLSDCFDFQLAAEPVLISSNLYGQEVDARNELLKNWGNIKKFVSSALQSRGIDNIVAEELSVFPGMEELFSLLLVKRYYQEGVYDLVILDCAPTDSTIRLLSFPDVLKWYLKKIFPIQRQVAKLARPIARKALDFNLPDEGVFEDIRGFVLALDGVKELLTDSKITTVRFVVNLEKMVIREAQRAYTYMNLFGYTVDAIFVNRIYPDEMGGAYMEHWKKIQKDYYSLIEESFSSSKLLNVKLFDREMLGLNRLDEFGLHIFGDINPVEIFCESKPMTIIKEKENYLLSWRIPGVTKSEIDLWIKGEDLILKTSKYMRNMVLPSVLAGKKIAGAVFKDDYLKITFTGAGAPRS